MIGYLTIKAVLHDGHEGIMMNCNIRGVSLRDKFLIMQSVEQALGVDHLQFMTYVLAKEQGKLDNDVRTVELERGNEDEG